LADLYKNFNELFKGNAYGKDYNILLGVRPSDILFTAIHGGGIETGCSELAIVSAGLHYSHYCFEGTRSSNNGELHITSTNWNEPNGVKAIRDSMYTVAYHGYYDSTNKNTKIGGRDLELASLVLEEFHKVGIKAELEPSASGIAGVETNNITNTNRRGKGLQLEISTAQRNAFFQTNTRSSRLDTLTGEFHKYVKAVRRAVEKYVSKTYPMANTINLIDRQDNTTDWILQSGTGTSLSVDTTYSAHNKSLKLVGNATPAFMKNTKKNIPLSNYSGLMLRVYIPDISAVNTLSVYLSNDTGLTKFGMKVFRNYQLVNGWNWLHFKKEEATTTNGFDYNGTVTTIQLRIDPVSGKNAIVNFEELFGIQSQRGNVLFTFDDNWDSQYSQAYRVLKQNGLKGTIAVIPSKVGTTNYMTLAQLKEVYNEGWDLANHTYNHVKLGEQTKETQRTELNNTRDYLNDNGFRRASSYAVYPYGSYNSDTLSVLKEEGYEFGRTIVTGFEETPSPRLKEVKVFNLTQDITLDEAKKKVDTAIATGSTVVFLNHRLGSTNDSMFYAVDKFESLVAYVKQKQMQNQLDVLTVSQYLKKH
jgi:phage replication-related protein YjqB (UPF0714/DUF867 family)/peptidoglycan/xylan/chitin deacetylase (PgdA/CDA1 family)